MTPLSRSRLSEAEAAMVEEMTGAPPYEGARPIELIESNEVAAQVVNALMCCHWAGALGFDVPFTDIVAALRFYKFASTEEIDEAESVFETLQGLSIQLNEGQMAKRQQASKGKSWVQ